MNRLLFLCFALLFACTSLYGQSFEFFENQKWGCIFEIRDILKLKRSNTHRIIFPQYEATCYVNSRAQGRSGFCLAKKEGKWGMVNEFNEVICPFIFDDINMAFDVESEHMTKSVLVDTRVDNTSYGDNLKYMLSFGTKNPFDKKQKMTFDLRYRSLDPQYSFSLNEYHLIAVKKDNLWGYIHLNGSWAIEPQFEEAYGFCQSNSYKGNFYYAANVKKDGYWGVIDRTGKVIRPYKEKKSLSYKKLRKMHVKDTFVPCSFEKPETYQCVYSKEVGTILNSDNLFQIVDKETQEPILPYLYEEVEMVNQDVLKVKRNLKWGLVNLNIGEIIPCIFDSIGDIDEYGRGEAYSMDVVADINVLGSCSIVPDNIASMWKSGMNLAEEEQYTNASKVLFQAKALVTSKEDDIFRYHFAERLAKEYYWSEKFRTGEAVKQPATSGWDLLSEALLTGQNLHKSFSGKAEGKYTSLNVSGTSASSGSIDTNSSLPAQYTRWEQLAQSHYKSLTNLGVRATSKSGQKAGSAGQGMSSNNYVQMKKSLREAQTQMQNIRFKAKQKGIQIQQSRWETATVSY